MIVGAIVAIIITGVSQYVQYGVNRKAWEAMDEAERYEARLKWQVENESKFISYAKTPEEEQKLQLIMLALAATFIVMLMFAFKKD